MARVMQERIDEQKELDNCTFVKTLLTLLVVLYHCIIFWTGSWFSDMPAYESEVLAVIAQWMNSFHIYGFTLVSGYLFYYLRYERGKYGLYWPFAIQKAKRLLIPYVFTAVVWVIPITYMFFPFERKEFISKFVLGTAPGQLWFLLMLFGVFLLFYPISNYVKEHHLRGALAVIGVYGVGLVGQMTLPNLFQIFSACMCVPIFWLGFKLRQCGSAWAQRIPVWLWLLIHALLFVLAQVAMQFSGVIFMLLRIGINFVLHIVGALMAFAVLQKLANKVNWKSSKAFGFISKLSMPVYLFHQQVVYVLIYLFNGLLNPYAHAAVNVAGAMAVSLALSALLMKFQITRFLIGEK